MQLELQGAAGIFAPVSVSYPSLLKLERQAFIATISFFGYGSGLASCPDTDGCDELGQVYNSAVLLFCHCWPECLPQRIWAGCSPLHNLTTSC